MRDWFWSRSKNSLSIQRIDSSFNQQDNILILKKALKEIDQKIALTIKDLLESQVVRYRVAFSKDRGIINKLKNNFYGSAARESANWHREKLLLLRKDRIELQTKLEKISGQYWPNKIRQVMFYLFILLMSILAIWIFFMGLITAVYLLPVWGSIVCIYLLVKHFKSNKY